MTLFINPLQIDTQVRAALDEDLGRAGDITSLATIPAGRTATADFVLRKPGTIAGLAFAEAAFRLLDPAITFETFVHDGQTLSERTTLARVSGPAIAILSGERVALNYLGRLSGIATLTARYVDAVKGTQAKIVCTRKTTPGLRAAEKYAVKCGGGANHRFGFDDAVLIKDNHIAVAGGIVPALRAAKEAVGHLVKIEIEVDTLDQLREVINEGADVVLLDNMNPTQLREAVTLIGGRMKSEASGGVNLDSVRAIAESGVDMISIGALTHSASVLDIGLDIAV